MRQPLTMVSLPTICLLVTDGTHDSPPLQPIGVPFIKGKHISSGLIDFDNCDFITEEDHQKCIKRVKPQIGDVLFANIGNSIGDVALVQDEREFSVKNLALFRPNPKKVDPTYFYYLVLSPIFQGGVLNIRSGAAQPFISLEAFRQHSFPFNPNKREQVQIGATLSAYDDLIANNRHRIQLLEQAARHIYKEWFVRLRFPGHEHTRVVDGVPVGWLKKTLDDVLAKIESGGRPKGGASDEIGVPSIGAENVIGIGQYDYTKEKYVPVDYFDHMQRGVIQNRDVLLYKDGANIGRSSYFGEGFPHQMCAVNEHVFILRTHSSIGQSWFYFWIDRDETRQRVANLNSNSAQPGVSQDKLKTLEITIPSSTLTSLYNETVEPVVKQIFVLARQNRSLIQARDILLPRLMSGDIDVS